MPEPHGTTDSSGIVESHGTAQSPREAARVIVLGDDGRVLLLRGHDPAQPSRSWWFSVGGGLDAGESHREAAVRELREEVGYVVDPESLVGPVWERTAIFDFMDMPYRQHEVFFVARVEAGASRVPTEWSEVERDMLDEVRWWVPSEVTAMDIEVFPERLGELLETVMPWDGVLRQLGEGG